MQNLDHHPRIIRETPPGDVTWAADRTRQVADDREQKCVLAVREIQGNIIGGFNKDRQTMVFLRLEDGADLGPVREWLARLEPQIATAEEVLAFNNLFKAMRARRRAEGFLKATWVNVAFSHGFLTRLAEANWGALGSAFEQGMAARSVERLNDPEDKNNPGNQANWKFGGRKNPIDVVLIVASDEADDLDVCVNSLKKELPPVLQVFETVHGATLQGDLKGHEHFGFLDDISQPGIRGLASKDPGDVLTRRQNPNDEGQGKPGQDLVWPGEFVFGYPEQKDPDLKHGKGHDDGPGREEDDPWLVNGSLLVVRRLRQNVEKFQAFLEATSRKLSSEHKVDVDADTLGAKLVGRWQSGAPIARAQTHDLPALGADKCANNDFEFNEAGKRLEEVGARGYCAEHGFPLAQPDERGKVCPFAAHVRRTYTRDDQGPDTGTASRKLSEAHAQRRRLLRRGIPFTTEEDRGLLFACYQTSIERQFEFVQASANDPNFKTAGAGHDLIIGQTNQNDRRRRARITVQECEMTVEAPEDFVVPTGGGYFFSPSIEVLKSLSAGRRPRRRA